MKRSLQRYMRGERLLPGDHKRIRRYKRRLRRTAGPIAAIGVDITRWVARALREIRAALDAELKRLTGGNFQ